MAKIAVVYHSGYGHTELVAKAVAKTSGATLMKVEEVNWKTLEEADTIVFGSPTYMGNVSAAFKQFMDDSGKPWLAQQWKDKLAAGFTNSGSPSGDKLNTLQTLSVFAAQHGMMWISTGMLPGGKNSEINKVGGYLGVMTQSENGPPSENNPLAHDIKTAEKFGERIKEFTARWVKGKQ